MKKKTKELGTDGVPTTSQAMPITGNAVVVRSVSTSDSGSATRASDHEILQTDVSKQNGTFAPGTSVSPMIAQSASTTTRGVAKIPRKSANAKRGNSKAKTSPSSGDETNLVPLTMNDSQDNGATEHVIFVSPGAVSVPGINVSNGSPNELNNSLELVDPGRADRDASLVIAAQLVTHDNEAYEQDEDLENRIEKEVESRLMKRGPILAVAEVMPPPDTTTFEAACKTYCWKWKYVLLFFLLCICGAVIGVIVSAIDGQPTAKTTRDNETQANARDIDEQPPASSTRDQEIQTKIMEVLQSHPNLTIPDDPTTYSPQSRALEWLLLYDTNSLTQNGTVSDTLIIERYVLAVLFHSTNGLYWQKRFEFLTQRPVCDWNDRLFGTSVDKPAYGVKCDAEMEVQQIWLGENGLNGTIPSELGLLSKLASLNLQSNALTNVIPTELGRLTPLQELDLAQNALRGTLPSELGHLTALRDLQVNANTLQGRLPTHLGDLVALEVLELSDCLFTGALPTELGRLTTLQVLDMASNTLTGRLPTQLGWMTSLVEIAASFNSFTGTLPIELGLLTTLQVFGIADNAMTGPLPTQLGWMTSLVEIDASLNSFTGTLPTELGRLTSLQRLDVASNNMTGQIPAQLGSMTSLVEFDTSFNSITGTLPTELGQLSILEIIPFVEDFYNDGGAAVFADSNSPQYQALVWLASDPKSVSLDVGRIRTLYALAVFYYSTNGDDFITYPTWSEDFGFLNSTDDICKWNNGNALSNPKGLWCDIDETNSKVERLYFSTNNLVGSIPEEIGMLTDLQYLLVAENRLTSTLPESLFKLSALKGVDLYVNAFTGLLPSTFTEATSLEIMHLGSNVLSGPFPLDHIVKTVFCPLKLVVLAGNLFTGTFPLESIAANCTDILAINVNDCGLVIEGSFPPIGLEQLRVLDLTKTQLRGSLPDEFSRMRLLEQFKADYNALTGTLPASLGDLMNLTDLSLASNGLNGTIPSTLGQLQQLTSLDLQANILKGSIPSELALCTNLVDVKLQKNLFSGDFDSLCPLTLESLSSDCATGNVVCTCCTECF